MIDRGEIIDLLQRVLDQFAGRLPADAYAETVGRVLSMRWILQNELDAAETTGLSGMKQHARR